MISANTSSSSANIQAQQLLWEFLTSVKVGREPPKKKKKKLVWSLFATLRRHASQMTKSCWPSPRSTHTVDRTRLLIFLTHRWGLLFFGVTPCLRCYVCDFGCFRHCSSGDRPVKALLKLSVLEQVLFWEAGWVWKRQKEIWGKIPSWHQSPAVGGPKEAGKEWRGGHPVDITPQQSRSVCMAGPNGLHACMGSRFKKKNAISVVNRGRNPFCPVGICVIWGRERRQNETDETLHDEWKKQRIESWREMWESKKQNYTEKGKWQTVFNLESYKNERPSRIVTKAMKHHHLWKPHSVLSVLLSSFLHF